MRPGTRRILEQLVVAAAAGVAGRIADRREPPPGGEVLDAEQGADGVWSVPGTP